MSVHKQQLLEVSEVGDGKVAGHDGLRGQSRHISFQSLLPVHQRGSPEGAPPFWVHSREGLKDPLSRAAPLGGFMDSDTPPSPLGNANPTRIQGGQVRRDQWSGLALHLLPLIQ